MDLRDTSGDKGGCGQMGRRKTKWLKNLTEKNSTRHEEQSNYAT